MGGKQYNFVVTGFGATAEAALIDARSRLPDPLYHERPINYFSMYREGNPVNVQDKFRVVIKYTPLEQTATQAKISIKEVESKPSSAGVLDIFEITR